MCQYRYPSYKQKHRKIYPAVGVLFQAKTQSRVDLVRIATHFETVEQCEQIAKTLKRLGYRVGLNLMQAHAKSYNELSQIAQLIQNWGKVDVLYFADSLGCMNADDVVKIILALKLGWIGDMGFHSHNNKGLAVSNSLSAIDNGVMWVDGSILGMGRGAGNAQTENLLLRLVQKYQFNYQPDALFDLILSDFTSLKNKYHWGESLLYNLAAIHKIHPTYIQEMLVDNRYNSREALQAIEFMSSLDDASLYDKNLLLQARGYSSNAGSWNAKGWCINKEVLILGSGASLQTYQKGIIQYIKVYKPAQF